MGLMSRDFTQDVHSTSHSRLGAPRKRIGWLRARRWLVLSVGGATVFDMDIETRFCSHCQTQRLFEVPACGEAHGIDCPDRACIMCGAAFSIAQFSAISVETPLAKVA